MLLAVFIVCGILIGLSTVSAENATGNNTTNVTVNPVSGYAGQNISLTANVTSNGSAANAGSVKFTVNNVSAGSASVNNSTGIATLNWLIPLHWALGSYAVTADFDGTGTDYANSTNSSNLTVNAPVMKAYWMRWDDLAPASTLVSQGITDVFLLTRGVDGNYHYDKLQWAIDNYKKLYGINVHAWIVCFKDDNSFVNPSGYYCYTTATYIKTVKKWGTKAIPYYKKVRVGKYKVGKKWKYIYKYVLKYRYKKGWIYTPIYSYNTVSGYDTSYNARLLAEIKNINDNYDIAGIHLDYVRYSGVSSNAACQQPGGTAAAVNTITNFVASVRGVVTKQLSAAVMPEMGSNPSYYAQDYSRLSNYLDFLVPMTYEGNYNKDDSWIKTVTQYVVTDITANGRNIPVYDGLTTYWSDTNLRTLSDSELRDDVASARAGGASGFVLFRYGFGNPTVPSW